MTTPGQGGIWVDTSQEAGCQWVDGPGPSPVGAGSFGMPVDRSAVGTRVQPQSQQPTPQAGQHAGLPLYHYPEAGARHPAPGAPAATAPPAPAATQDMVFQWVDCPAFGRQGQQQHYLGAPAAPPYFQDPAAAAALSAQGLADPAAAAQFQAQAAHAAAGLPGAHLQPPLADPRFAAPQQDLAGYATGYDQAFGQPRPPQPLGVEDLAAFRGAGAGYGMMPDQNAYQGMGNNSYDQGRRGGQGAKGGQASKGDRGRNDRQPAASGGDRGRGDRQSPTAAKKPEGGGASSGGAAAGGARKSAEASPDAQLSSVLEGLGAEGLRSMLTGALESLYQDRIKPMASYVKGRLKERSNPEPIVKSFVELYSQHSDLFLVQQPTQGDEAAIFFVTEPEWFKGWIDIDSPSDPYDETLWQELAKFLDGEHTFAGGRYGMARELMQRNLEFLKEQTLGEVCHIVQLAIQHRKLIVYHRKMLKPIQTVLCQPPANGTGAAEGGEEIKDMDDLCLVLFRMLIRHPQGIPLCRIKQMIKHELSRKLSEMAFKCTKLIELFNQEPLSKTFLLDTDNDGKSIYVHLGKPETLTEPVKQIYAMATSLELQAAQQQS